MVDQSRCTEKPFWHNHSAACCPPFLRLFSRRPNAGCKNRPPPLTSARARFDRRDGRVQGSLARDAQRHVEIFPVSYTHLRAHETKANLVCRLLLEKKKNK